ncbi:MAG: SOS response-associated peptidase [Bacteroidota bacterium]
MCGRFSLTKTETEIEARFGAKFYSNDLIKRYNVAPSQLALVLTNNNANELQFFKWGLIPSWAKDSNIGNRMINARFETLKEKPSFKNLINRKRCLVIADGFYEWRNVGGKKKPVRITLMDEKLFAMAGLWDEWRDPINGNIVKSFTVVTVPANELISPIHDRMPAILHPNSEKNWLNLDPIDDMLTTYPENPMNLYPVSDKLNSPSNDSPDLINPSENLFN